MLGVGLREHHQLDVGRVALCAIHEDFDEVVDLVVRERQPQAHVGLDQRGTATGEQVNRGQLLRREVVEEFGGVLKAAEHGLDHAVMDQRCDGIAVRADRQLDVEGDAALDALDGSKATVPGDVGSLRRPRRNGADARRDEEQRPRGIALRSRHLLEQRSELLTLGGIKLALELDHMPVLGAGKASPRYDGGNALLQALETESGERGSPAQEEDVGDVGHGR